VTRLNDLNLKFGLQEWNTYQKRERLPQFQEFAKKVKKRDFDTCKFCGFTADEGMTVVNLDHNYNNNVASNLVTACPLCAQCLFVEHVGCGGDNGGVLIYLPEMTQAELNGLVHALFCAIANATMHETSAQSLYNALRLRAQVVEKTYGEGRSDPKVFGKMVINTPTTDSKSLHQHVFKNLRVLANITSFSQQIRTWSQKAASDMNTGILKT